MRTLVFDIGNTAVKYGCFEDDVLLETAAGLTLDQLLTTVQRLQPQHVLAASVAASTADWIEPLRHLVAGTVVEFAPATTPVPLRNAYATPHTLGADRLAAAVGAAWLRPSGDTLVVDAGTAIKCDWVERGHTFRGGSIAPGLRMRFAALHQLTGRLPLVAMPTDPTAAVALMGDDTQAAIRSGVLNGAVAEVEGLIARYRASSPRLAVILAGGDARFFQPRLKGHIFVIPELVLLGLHRILVHNVEN
ncbi:type III pantothenate kinase [Hymenobacter fastidiosus]|uniref:Type III pantothenate kinase n=1 Tax=Hymenobacter fastidiosus TaxID=486264 RepID=A0ABP7T0Q3_9BACT